MCKAPILPIEHVGEVMSDPNPPLWRREGLQGGDAHPSLPPSGLRIKLWTPAPWPPHSLPLPPLQLDLPRLPPLMPAPCAASADEDSARCALGGSSGRGMGAWRRCASRMYVSSTRRTLGWAPGGTVTDHNSVHTSLRPS